jgi:predicted nucleotidyltransferase
MTAVELFPTSIHRAAADAIVSHFDGAPGVAAVLLLNSCARGMGAPQSDLDVAVLVDGLASADIARLQAQWDDLYATDVVLQRLQKLGRFTAVHLDIIEGNYTPAVWDDGGGPDAFEIEIGNHVAYSAPLWCSGPKYANLRAQWLPYYDEALRRQRLEMVRAACHYTLDFVPFYVGRELYFQAFDRLYKAHQEFLQALFIARRVYPLTYNKWIRLQVAEWLGLPALYNQLPYTLQISRLESDELVAKAAYLRGLLETWTTS